MIISREPNDINSVYDFYEGIISGIKWDIDSMDLLLSVIYFYDEPVGLKDKEIIIRFKHCKRLFFDFEKSVAMSMQLGTPLSYQEIETFHITQNVSEYHVEISSNLAEHLLTLDCMDIWLESKTADSE